MTPAEAVQELLAVLDGKDRPRSVTLTELAAGHAPQFAFTADAARWIIALCSRRAGKTSGIAARMLVRALEATTNQVYIALTKDSARNVAMWEPIWKPLLRKWKVPASHHETTMITRFPNGSVIRFTGSDDVRHIETELGAALDQAVLDECQSSPDSVLRPLAERILPPALSDRRGSLVLAGTVPQVEAGYFWDIWKDSNWSKHNWSMFDNPHMPNARAELDEYLVKNPGLTINSPVVQRERFGRFVFDKSETAHAFDRDLNTYQAVPPQWLQTLRIPSGSVMASEPWLGIDIFSVGIDPAAEVDRMAVVVNGWGQGNPNVQQVFEWVSDKGARHTWNQLGELLGFVASKWNCSFWHYDAGSSKNELDTFQRLYGVPVIKAAEKSDLIGQVRMVSGLLTSGKYKVMKGSKLQEDYEKSRWDQDALGRGQYRWASAWHPDPADASRYSLRPYFDAYQKPDTRTIQEHMRDQERERIEQLLDRSRTGFDVQDQLGRILGYDG